jgi:hypothetical protein
MNLVTIAATCTERAQQEPKNANPIPNFAKFLDHLNWHVGGMRQRNQLKLLE